MSDDAETIAEAALRLSEEERFMIVSRLLSSMPPVPTLFDANDPEFVAELNRRSADLTGAVPWEELEADK